MPAYLSPEWLEAFDAAARTSAVSFGDGDARLVVEQRVTGTPHGDVTYHLVFDTGLSVESGAAPDADVVLVTDYDTAVDLFRGELNAQRAVAAGRMKLQGRIGLLLRHRDAFDALSDVFRSLRDETT